MGIWMLIQNEFCIVNSVFFSFLFPACSNVYPAAVVHFLLLFTDRDLNQRYQAQSSLGRLPVPGEQQYMHLKKESDLVDY